jgi:hypothetical protein
VLHETVFADDVEHDLGGQPVADDAGALLAIGRPRFRLDAERVGA